MFEKFTDRARRVLVLAQQEAREASHDEITPDHVLLGCAVEHDGIAGRVLETFSVTSEQLRRRVVEIGRRTSTVSPVEAVASVGIDLLRVQEAVEQSFGEGSFPLPGERAPFATAGREVLEAAVAASLEWGHNYIGTEHLLLGLLQAASGEAGATLSAVGVDPAAVEQRTKAVMHRYAVIERQPSRDRARDLRRGVLRVPADIREHARQVMAETVNAQPVMPLVATDAEFDAWMAETELQLAAAVDVARDRLSAIGALSFVDAVASLMKTAEAAELQGLVDQLRNQRDKLQVADTDNEDSVNELARIVRREKRATEIVDELWMAVWNHRDEWSHAELVSQISSTTISIQGLP